MNYRFRQSDLHWLAGLIEGEGSFMATKVAKDKYAYPCIQIGSVDRDVIARVESLVPEGILRVEHPSRNGSKGQTFYRWRLYKRVPALALAEALRPLMGERRTGQLDCMVERVMEGRP